MKNIIVIILIVFSLVTYGQSPRVPARMSFAGMDLRINESARKAIQKDVDMLTQSPKYYHALAEKAKSYFPIIEEIFEREGVPTDFKYLVLQESSLIADAVSSSDAVGYWQMKDFTAMEFGLIVNKDIDERMSIVASTMGASRYFKKANEVFDNWLHSLQSYQMGIGGAQRALGDREYGAKSLHITPRTYWYVRKFLAYKVAFEDITKAEPILSLALYRDTEGKSVNNLSRELNLEPDIIRDYNKWILGNKIPEKGVNILLVPSEYNKEVTAIYDRPKVEKILPEKVEPPKKSDIFPRLNTSRFSRHKYIIGVNGKPGIIAGDTDTQQSLAMKGDISHRKLIRVNDLSLSDKIVPGQVYYFKRKKNKAKTYYHTIREGEDLWEISQKYGIKLKKLKSKNRIKVETEQTVKPGRVLWLRHIRPRDTPVKYVEIEPENSLTPVLDNTTIATAIKADSNSDTVQDHSAPEVDTTINFPADTIRAVENNEKISTLAEKGTEFLYEVKKGDTYYSISEKFDVGVVEILNWNNREINEPLYVGQQLVILLKEKPASGKIHIVKKGETIYGISNVYNVKIDDIIRWNNLTNSNLKIGQQLRIE